MDDRNGECFEHHEDLYCDGPLNTSDSEHDCLKEFLLEPRNVPCNVDSDRAETSQNDNNCAERTENCTELINCQNSCSSTAGTEDEHLSLDLSESLKDDKVRDSESSQFKGETETENSSDLSSLVQKDVESTELPNEPDTQQLTKSEAENVDTDLGNELSAERPCIPKVSRGRKRKGTETGATRGRPPGSTKKKKQPVTYQSQISPDQNGIKLRIKKSSAAVQRPHRRKKRKGKKGSNTEDEASDSDSTKRAKWKEPNGSEESEGEEVGIQSCWGLQLPRSTLYCIFKMITQEEGCLPFLVRMTRVCRLWRDVALSPSLWHNIDLSGSCIKDRYKRDETVRWLCENRLTAVQELSVGGWKIGAIQPMLEVISKCCQQLRGLNMSGWRGLSPEHLKFLIANCPQLSRLDLSSINPESNSTRSAVSPLSMSHMTQTMGDKLTHLILANNKLAAIPQLISAIAAHCPNLQVLDLSNLRTVSHTTALLHIEKLQEGCQKLRVLRITNSQIALSSATLKEQVASAGFPALEELSVAGISVDGLCSTPVMDDNAIERILKCSHKLRLLDVRGCSRVSDSSLVRVPAWDLEHLFLSGCFVTRLTGSGLELIAQKWSHSLVEMDLAWSTATQSLDLAVTALAERGSESPLRVLNLCGSSVSLSPVKAVLLQCPLLVSLNLSSCRALPRGMKRLYEGNEVNELRSTFEEKPENPKSSLERDELDSEQIEEQTAVPAGVESGGSNVN